jgi:hypothetical protein
VSQFLICSDPEIYASIKGNNVKSAEVKAADTERYSGLGMSADAKKRIIVT